MVFGAEGVSPLVGCPDRPPPFQVNRSDSEHIIAIPHTYIEFYSVLDRATGRPLDPAHALAFFSRHGLRHVPMSLHRATELPAVVAAVRSDHTAEGAVLYLNNAAGDVIGLLKVKVRRVCCVFASLRAIAGRLLFPGHNRLVVLPSPGTASSP